MRDQQKNKVYSWEQRYIAPHDKSQVPFEQIQSLVDHVWEQEGLQHPPRVKNLPRNAHCRSGDATRTIVRFHEGTTPTWIILHELAHSMTSDVDHNSNWHGSLFVGQYILLVSKYLGIKLSDLIVSARKDDVKYKLGYVCQF